MQCLTCKYFFGIDDSIDVYKERTKDTCQQCKDNSKFVQATDEDYIAEGIAIFERKMQMSQYKEYINNETAQDRLLQDCIRESCVRGAINANTITMLAAKKAKAGN